MNLDNMDVAKAAGKTIECSYCGNDVIRAPGYMRVIGLIRKPLESAKQVDFRVICTECDIALTDKLMGGAAKPKAEKKAAKPKKEEK